jgi:ribosomal protein S18 acetylase RimI-like enzyme
LLDIRIEPAQIGDATEILELYRDVAAVEGRLARAADEVSAEYVRGFVARSMANGIILVARIANESRVAGEVHAHPLGPRAFAHVLGELTIAVHPIRQGRGIGRALIKALVDAVTFKCSHVQRVELIARESNAKAISLYENLGFRAEGRLVNRILGRDGQYEADIPMAWVRAEKGI